MLSRLLTVAQVSYELGVTSNRVYQLIAAGEIPAVRLGRSVRVPRESWEKWLMEKQSDSITRVEANADERP
jgi:excisionase family DNA binding protein